MPENKGMIYKAFDVVKSFCTPKRREQNRMRYFLDLAKDIGDNNLGYLSGAGDCRAQEKRGFLRLESPEEYNKTAGDYIPND